MKHPCIYANGVVALLWFAGLSALVAHCAAGAVADGVSAAPSLEEGFADPPASCRPETWWWFGDCVSAPDAAITRDLEGMKKVGLSNA